MTITRGRTGVKGESASFRLRRRYSPRRRFVNFPALHHEVDLLENADIGQRIALYSYQICVFSGSDTAYIILHPQKLGGVQRRAAYRLGRSHAVFHHVGKFHCRIDAPVESAHIRTESDFYAGLQRSPEGIFVNLDHLQPDLGASSGPALRDILAYIDRRHIVDALLGHGFQVGVSDVVSMFDGVDAGFHGIVNSVQRHGVRSDFVMLAVCFIYDGVQLVDGEGGDIVEHAVGAHKVTSVGIELDPIGAEADLLAHGFAGVVRAVDYLHAMRHWNLGSITQERIGPGHVHGSRGDLHARAGNNAVVDGFLEIDVRVSCAFGLQIANGCEAVVKSATNRARRHDRPIRHRLLQELL